MANRDKRIAAMRRNPHTVRPDELDAVLRTAGFTSRQHGSSHKIYSNGRITLPVPQRQPFLLLDYVKDALDALDGLAAAEDDDDGDSE